MRQKKNESEIQRPQKFQENGMTRQDWKMSVGQQSLLNREKIQHGGLKLKSVTIFKIFILSLA